MAVEYVLRKNPLMTESPGYAASVVTAGSAGLDRIADRIVEQGSTVGRADVLAVLENALAAADSLLQEGFRVQLGGIVDLFPRIKGRFASPTDLYDPARHQVDVAAMPGRRLRKAFHRSAAVKRIGKAVPAPALVAFSQQPPPPQAGTITAGAIGILDGSRLKFEADRADEGIFLVKGDGTGEIKIETVQKNTPKQLVFLVPAVPAGCRYRLEVRARHRGGTALRVGRLDESLAGRSPRQAVVI